MNSRYHARQGEGGLSETRNPGWSWLWNDNAIAEESSEYDSSVGVMGGGPRGWSGSVPEAQGEAQGEVQGEARKARKAQVEQAFSEPASQPEAHPPRATPFDKELEGRVTQAEAIRLAMALIEGARQASSDRAEKVEQLRERIRQISGQPSEPQDDSDTDIGKRLRSLSRTNDRNLAEQLKLQVRFDEAERYKEDGCRSMIVWMDVHLGIAKTNASEQLRVGRALQDLPILESLFTLGQISFSQLREVTRVATPQTDAEFALATLALSVSETREYCLRFRHDIDRDEDARLAMQHGQDVSDSHAAMRAYDRRSLRISEPDVHTTRIVIELPRELGEEFRRSLEHCEDWIREGGEDASPNDASDIAHQKTDLPGSMQKTSAEMPTRTTATQLRADAALLMSRRSLAHAGEAVAMADRYRVHVNVDLDQLLDGCVEDAASQRTDDHRANAVVERPWLHGAGPVSRATTQRLAEIAGFTLVVRDETGEAFATASKAPPFTRRQLKELRARDRRCQMPGCGSTRHVEGHHIVHRENGGRSTMENAVHVCGACHRLLHEGGFRLERIGPNGADLGGHAHATNADAASRQRAQAKVSRIRRYRLYGPDGTEYDSVNAARARMYSHVGLDGMHGPAPDHVQQFHSNAETREVSRSDRESCNDVGWASAAMKTGTESQIRGEQVPIV
ncbi:HNH endonuclease signature motif containing protein [Granulosicoccus sp. 3-233]|uniref:HNH endonuclease signature motif containing protein n=1 Tax=Granulosicoccus sp. 3-233 TaxID=3417969 RepID=UPI003D336D2D